MSIVKGSTLLISGFVASMNVAVCFMSLKELIDNLQDLSSVLNKKSNAERPFFDGSKVKYFRRIQVFGNIFNECFQMYNFTVVEICGCMLGIFLGYTFILYNHLFGPLGKLAVTGCFAALLCFKFFVMDIGSRSLLISSKIICRVNKICAHNDCEWLRKYIKSRATVS